MTNSQTPLRPAAPRATIAAALVGVVAALSLSACAAVDSGTNAAGAQAFEAADPAIEADAAEIERVLEALYLSRDEFDLAGCATQDEAAFFATLAGELYSVPMADFLVGRPARGGDADASAGCRETPLRAGALTFSLGADGAETTAAELQVTLVTNARQRTLSRRTARILALVETGACDAVDAAPNFLRCDTEEPVFSSIESTTYFVSASAETPSVAGAPFAVRCVERDIARPCSIIDRLDAKTLIAIDYDPSATDLTELVSLHALARDYALSLQRGTPT